MKTKQKRKIGKRIEENKQKLEKTVEKTLLGRPTRLPWCVDRNVLRTELQIEFFGSSYFPHVSMPYSAPHATASVWARHK
jgi:hypothetical protein